MVLVDDGVLLYGGCIGGDVFGDVWLLHETANPNNDLTQEYEWIPLDPPAAAPPPTVARLPPPAPPPSNASDSSARPVPDLLPGAPGSAGGPMAHAGSTGFGPTHPTPPARCAHTAAAIEGGMLLFGGRRPLTLSLNPNPNPNPNPIPTPTPTPNPSPNSDPNPNRNPTPKVSELRLPSSSEFAPDLSLLRYC